MPSTNTVAIMVKAVKKIRQSLNNGMSFQIASLGTVKCAELKSTNSLFNDMNELEMTLRSYLKPWQRTSSRPAQRRTPRPPGSSP